MDVGIESLAQTYAPALKRFFERRILEAADVDDLVQDVFLRLTRHGVGDINNLEGYIFQTAANVLRDRLRRRLVRQSADHEPLNEDLPEDEALSPERVLLGKEALNRLTTALLDLPDRTQAIFMQCRIEGVPYAEVARRFGISLSAVNKHMARAMDCLMTVMKD